MKNNSYVESDVIKMKVKKIIIIIITTILVICNFSITSNAVKIDDAIDTADGFLQHGTTNPIDEGQLKTFSLDLFNIFSTVGMVIAVGIGMFLGVKFMMASAEDKAKVKEALVPYVAGCIVIFGAMGIWKLAIILLRDIA